MRGYWSQNKREWSAEIHGDHALYAVIYMCMRSVRGIEDKKHHTKESHRKKMDAEAAETKKRDALREVQTS